MRLSGKRGSNRAARALSVDRAENVACVDASAARVRHEVARYVMDVDRAARRARHQRAVDVASLDIAAGSLELSLAAGGGELDVAARRARVDVSLDAADVGAAAGGLADHLAVKVGDANVAAGRTEVNVVRRRYGYGVVGLEVVPIEHMPLVFVGAANVHVVPFLGERELIVVDVGSAAAADDLHSDLVRGRGAKGKVAEIRFDRESSSRLHVEGPPYGVTRGMGGNGKQREGKGDADGTDAMHDVTSDGCYYATAGKKLAEARVRVI